MGKAVRLSERDYDRLKKISERQDIPMAQIISKALKSLEVKKVKNEENVVICNECELKIPEDSVFCPYCGVEFDEEEDLEEDEEDEEFEGDDEED